LIGNFESQFLEHQLQASPPAFIQETNCSTNELNGEIKLEELLRGYLGNLVENFVEMQIKSVQNTYESRMTLLEVENETLRRRLVDEGLLNYSCQAIPQGSNQASEVSTTPSMSMLQPNQNSNFMFSTSDTPPFESPESGVPFDRIRPTLDVSRVANALREVLDDQIIYPSPNPELWKKDSYPASFEEENVYSNVFLSNIDNVHCFMPFSQERNFDSESEFESDTDELFKQAQKSEFREDWNVDWSKGILRFMKYIKLSDKVQLCRPTKIPASNGRCRIKVLKKLRNPFIPKASMVDAWPRTGVRVQVECGGFKQDMLAWSNCHRKEFLIAMPVMESGINVFLDKVGGVKNVQHGHNPYFNACRNAFSKAASVNHHFEKLKPKN